MKRYMNWRLAVNMFLACLWGRWIVIDFGRDWWMEAINVLFFVMVVFAVALETRRLYLAIKKGT